MAINQRIKKVLYGDLTVWIIFLFLSCFSLMEVFSATSTLAHRNDYLWGPIMRHATFLFSGTLLIFILSRTPSRFFSLAILFLPISAVLLTATFFFGISMNEAQRFLTLFGIQFQPSEFAKLGCIVYVAFLLSKRRTLSEKWVFRLILGGVLPVCALIFVFNLSTAALLLTVCILLMFIGQISYRRMGLLLLGLTLFAALLVLTLRLTPHDTVRKVLPRATTWKNRIDRYLGAKTEPDGRTYVSRDDDYQITHARAALAGGGVFPKGPGGSVQRDFLPQPFSDFIYAIIVEELGIIGGLTVLVLYIMLMIRVKVIAGKCDKLFAKYLVIGCGLLIVVQALLHIAVNVDLAPVTGQPLPLISRGGTSTVLTCIYIGIILSVSHYGAGMSDEDDADFPLFDR